MNETLGQHQRALRHKAGMRLVDLSEATGLSVSYLNDLEHDRGLPSLPALHIIAGAFDLTIGSYLEGVNPYGFSPS